MNVQNLDKLILQTSFCCMASDGNIDEREINLIKSMCENSPLFKDFEVQTELNKLVEKINAEGKSFITNYLALLKNTTLSEDAELTLLEFAIQTILADEIVEYSEIKFFKNIRYRLEVSDEKILERFSDISEIELFLGQDIITESFLDKISNLYLDSIEFPQFEAIIIDEK